MNMQRDNIKHIITIGADYVNSGSALDIGKFNRRNGENYPGKGHCEAIDFMPYPPEIPCRNLKISADQKTCDTSDLPRLALIADTCYPNSA